MKYLITGGAGFIGIKLVEKLLKNKTNKVYIIDNLSKKTGNKNALKILTVYHVCGEETLEALSLMYQKENGEYAYPHFKLKAYF